MKKLSLKIPLVLTHTYRPAFDYWVSHPGEVKKANKRWKEKLKNKEYGDDVEEAQFVIYILAYHGYVL